MVLKMISVSLEPVNLKNKDWTKTKVTKAINAQVRPFLAVMSDTLIVVFRQGIITFNQALVWRILFVPCALDSDEIIGILYDVNFD